MMTSNTLGGSDTKQYIFENDSWLRLLEFLAQENDFMKNRLSEVIDRICDREQLALAEHYQNQFIIKDDLYEHLKYELRMQTTRWKDLSKKEFEEELQPDLIKAQKHFREQMEFIERDHTVLKKDYNTYLASLPC